MLSFLFFSNAASIEFHIVCLLSQEQFNLRMHVDYRSQQQGTCLSISTDFSHL